MVFILLQSRSMFATEKQQQEVEMRTSADADYLLRRAQQESRKANEMARRGDHRMAIFIHRELAVMYQARAAALKIQ